MSSIVPARLRGIHDTFTASGIPLTWSQMADVQQGYAEAING